MEYIAPKKNGSKFTCPHCDTLTQQNWWGLNGEGHPVAPRVINVSTCVNCIGQTVWYSSQMVFPDVGSAPSPNPDMPENVKELYHEANSISHKSLRGSAALLRLGLQLLCKELGEEGKNINTDIKNLVAKGLHPIVQKSLDIVRVKGNDAVHTGLLDTDDEKTLGQLFGMLNIIVQYMITMPKHVESTFDSLPEDKKNGIESRDAKRE